MNEPNVRLSDIAEAVGVSKATVSRVLHGGPHNRVGVATRQAILEAAERLGYRPNVAARALAGGTAPLLGVIVPGIQTQHFPRLIAGVEAAACEAGLQTIVTTAGRDRDHGQAEAVRALAPHKVSGLIVCPRDNPAADRALAEALSAAAPPVVIVDRPFAALPLPCVLPDNEGGGRRAGEALLADSCDPLLFVAGHPERVCSLWQSRLAGMREAAGSGVEVCFLDAPESPDLLRRAAAAGRPGVFMNSFFDLPRLVAVLQAAGLRLPAATRLWGFDEGVWGLDRRDVHGFLVSLETWPVFIAYPEFDLGYAAAELLLARVRDGVWEQERIVVPVTAQSSREV